MTQIPQSPPSLASAVATATDAAALGANAPALMLEILTDLGALASLATAATERGRRPFRPPAGWGERLGAIGFALYNLADQTGIDLDTAVRARAGAIIAQADQAARQAPEEGWPFTTE
ncbi:MAG: hypothetical protein ACR2KJ_02585 [Jatrophihabitans sp.]